MRVSYGVNDFEYNSHLIDDAETLIQRFSETTVPGRLLVNSFPFLRHVPDWFPGTQWKQILKEVAVISNRVVSKPFADAKIRLVGAHPLVANRSLGLTSFSPGYGL